MRKIFQLLFKLIYIKREDQQPSLNINLSLLFITLYLVVILMGISYIMLSVLKVDLSENCFAAIHLGLVILCYVWMLRYKGDFYEIAEKGSYYSFGRINGVVKILFSISILGFLILIMNLIKEIF
jgi:hypothetical protein